VRRPVQDREPGVKAVQSLCQFRCFCSRPVPIKWAEKQWNRVNPVEDGGKPAFATKVNVGDNGAASIWSTQGIDSRLRRRQLGVAGHT
jgi:hypothetical protein